MNHDEISIIPSLLESYIHEGVTTICFTSGVYPTKLTKYNHQRGNPLSDLICHPKALTSEAICPIKIKVFVGLVQAILPFRATLQRCGLKFYPDYSFCFTVAQNSAYIYIYISRSKGASGLSCEAWCWRQPSQQSSGLCDVVIMLIILKLMHHGQFFVVICSQYFFHPRSIPLQPMT